MLKSDELPRDLVDMAKCVTGGAAASTTSMTLSAWTASSKASRRFDPRGLLALYGEASGLVPPLDVRKLLMAGLVYLTRTGLSTYADPREKRKWRQRFLHGWRTAS